jgi:hypothetical protein
MNDHKTLAGTLLRTLFGPDLQGTLRCVCVCCAACIVLRASSFVSAKFHVRNLCNLLLWCVFRFLHLCVWCFAGSFHDFKTFVQRLQSEIIRLQFKLFRSWLPPLPLSSWRTRLKLCLVLVNMFISFFNVLFELLSKYVTVSNSKDDETMSAVGFARSLVK